MDCQDLHSSVKCQMQDKSVQHTACGVHPSSGRIFVCLASPVLCDCQTHHLPAEKRTFNAFFKATRGVGITIRTSNK